MFIPNFVAFFVFSGTALSNLVNFCGRQLLKPASVGHYRGQQLKTSCGKVLNLAHYFPYDVKLRLLAHSRSFLANQKARTAIVGAENLLKGISKFSAPTIAFLAFSLVKKLRL